MADDKKTPWDDNAKQERPAKPSIRSRLSIVLLVGILAFFGYGVFERTRLVAELTRERAAVESVAALHGETMEADSKDWRAIFSPDRPEQATRIGYVTLPSSGPAPGYQKKVAEILENLSYCRQLYVTATPEKKEKKEEESKEKPKEEQSNANKSSESPEKTESTKSEEKAAEAPTELLNVDELKTQFPNLVIHVVPYVPKGETRGPMGT